jgi:hypothetical protein
MKIKVELKKRLRVGTYYGGVLFTQGHRNALKGEMVIDFDMKSNSVVVHGMLFSGQMLNLLSIEYFFSKDDLKNKMIVKTREGILYIKVDDALLGKNGFMLIDNYEHNLEHKNNRHSIDKVYIYRNNLYQNCNASGIENMLNEEHPNIEVIFERAVK